MPDPAPPPGPIGVLGAGGLVGAAVLERLAGTAAAVRAGRRTWSPTHSRPAGPALRRVERVEVDLDRPGDVERLATGCSVVINCAGSVDSVRSSVLRAGPAHVDAGSTERPQECSVPGPPGRRGISVSGSGVLPGLSGLMIRWLLAARPPGPVRLTGHVVTVDRITRAAAAEMLLGLRHDGPRTGAALRHGLRVRCPAPRPVPRPTFLPAVLAAPEVVLRPYLTAEVERLAQLCGVTEAVWFQVFDAEGRVPGVLAALHGRMLDGEPLDRLVTELVRSAELEVFGRRTGQVLALQVEQVAPAPGARPRARSAVVHLTSTYEATAAVAVAVAHAVRDGSVGPGGHLAAEVLDPAMLPGLLVGVGTLRTWDGPLAEPAETGSL